MKTFPQKLMTIVDDKSTDEAIRWIPGGKAFLLNPKTITKTILDKHFQGSKFESFTRRLYRYGFRKVMENVYPSSVMVYHHKLFLRGRPEILKHLTGGRRKIDDPAVLENIAGFESIEAPQRQVNTWDAAEGQEFCESTTVNQQLMRQQCAAEAESGQQPTSPTFHTASRVMFFGASPQLPPQQPAHKILPTTYNNLVSRHSSRMVPNAPLHGNFRDNLTPLQTFYLSQIIAEEDAASARRAFARLIQQERSTSSELVAVLRQARASP